MAAVQKGFELIGGVEALIGGLIGLTFAVIVGTTLEANQVSCSTFHEPTEGKFGVCYNDDTLKQLDDRLPNDVQAFGSLFGAAGAFVGMVIHWLIRAVEHAQSSSTESTIAPPT